MRKLGSFKAEQESLDSLKQLQVNSEAAHELFEFKEHESDQEASFG